MSASEWKVAVGEETTSAIYEPPTFGDEVAIAVFAHGAGGNKLDRGVVASAKAFRANGIGAVRFNFLYKEKRSGRPDPMPRLMATFAAVVALARAMRSPGRMLIGGRSMGGRAASMLAADGFSADGLLLLAYPLHPVGQPEKLRDKHLPMIQMPVLCFSGTRDGFCTRDLMERALTTVTAPWDMRWIDGADHTFHMLKSSGRTDKEVMDEIGRVSGEWAARLP